MCCRLVPAWDRPVQDGLCRGGAARLPLCSCPGPQVSSLVLLATPRESAVLAQAPAPGHVCRATTSFKSRAHCHTLQWRASCVRCHSGWLHWCCAATLSSWSSIRLPWVSSGVRSARPTVRHCLSGARAFSLFLLPLVYMSQAGVQHPTTTSS